MSADKVWQQMEDMLQNKPESSPQLAKNPKLEEDGTIRIFTKAQKDICWNNAPAVPGRDPARWRIDAVGNPVIYTLRGCHGSLCHEYDHIVPFSKGGKTEVSNCQILQTGVNRFKSDKQPTLAEMKTSSRVLRLSNE